MKHLLTAMICVFSFAQTIAQTSNLIFFTDGGENFILFVNGVRQNGTPAANVKATGVTGDFVQIKVQFEESGLGELSQGMMVQPGMEMTSIIKKNNKGKLVFRPVSSVPLGQGTESTTTAAASQSSAATSSTSATATTPTESSTVSTTTTTTTTANPANAGTVGVSISDGQGGGINMNVNVNVADVQTQASQTTVVTTTTSSTTSSTSSSSAASSSSTPVASSAPAASSSCTAAMSATDFESAKKAISSKSFADDKMTVSKQILKNNCVSVKQVKGFIELFSYEENRLEFAKLAYPKTVDKGNYYQVNDSFSFSGSISELNAFLESQD